MDPWSKKQKTEAAQSGKYLTYQHRIWCYVVWNCLGVLHFDWFVVCESCRLKTVTQRNISMQKFFNKSACCILTSCCWQPISSQNLGIHIKVCSRLKPYVPCPISLFPRTLNGNSCSGSWHASSSRHTLRPSRPIPPAPPQPKDRFWAKAFVALHAKVRIHLITRKSNSCLANGISIDFGEVSLSWHKITITWQVR